MRFYQFIFGVLIVYTWGLAMFVDHSAIDEQSPFWYALTVAPAVLFIVMALPAIIRPHYQKATLALVFMSVLASVFSIVRKDFTTALSVTSLCAMLVAIRHTKVTLGYQFANILFVLSIVCAGLMQASDLGLYGIIPGQSADESVAWRISLFPYTVTPSWLFALVVLALNAARNRGLSRFMFMAAALYFLIFSASRTGYIILMLWLAFLVCSRVIHFRRRFFYAAFIPLAMLMFVLALNAESILTILVGFDNPLANAVLFKTENGVGSTDQASTSIARTLVWTTHAQLFLQEPLIGAGTVDVQDITPALAQLSSHGTESFLTALFARIGSVAVLFMMFMHYLARGAARRGDKLCYCLLILFAISSLAYGSYIVPYDFVFLIVFAAMNVAHRDSVRHVGWRAPVLDPVGIVILEADRAAEPVRRLRPR